ncbi:MAG: hypothetical protein A3E37_01480 [Candidatus Andersenbacteria bacterium RIFCSPHIGHO2_12_FULL_46_9]|nr:MAG: hypothetical protein UW94_C0020G0015 [Parcubacteria group bacterium GW2011_GWA2_45_14]OGY35807.1 MAG: hypothetical protein A3E37_01480 [Candidatus Andersenbacteria bacterium RIFCSPHIGHO2_12_FULL_46_9]OGY35949.1 MAG: hypothetical protein A3B76_04210 [Candidatus Andersenbacteria bacterium RIFCSPHIGHO2_02_FULL_46_16]OGY39004.1 MAG: hypothetical protein A3G57_03775 [Candidatus Andersenbacteria bacterium RIFCSPLOWO2_12_FULL_45_8]
MLADWILKILGTDPSEFPRPENKWPVIFADLTDLLVPVVITGLFILPLLIIKFRKNPFTALNVILAVIIGALLAYGAWWLNEWSYGYGQAVIFRAIYE